MNILSAISHHLDSSPSAYSGAVMPMPMQIPIQIPMQIQIAMPTPMRTSHVSALTSSLKQKHSTPPLTIITTSIPITPTTTTTTTASTTTAPASTPNSPTSISPFRNGCTLRKVARFANLQPTLIEQSRYLHISPKDESARSLDSTSTSIKEDDEEQDYTFDTFTPTAASLPPSYQHKQQHIPMWLNNNEMDHGNKSLSLSSSLIPPTPTFLATNSLLCGPEDDQLQFSLDLEHGTASFVQDPSMTNPQQGTQKFQTYYNPHHMYKPQPVQPYYYHHRDHLNTSADCSVWSKGDLYFAPHSRLLPDDSPISDSPPLTTIDPSGITHHNKSAPCFIPGSNCTSSNSATGADRARGRLTRSHGLLDESKRRWSNPEKEQNSEKEMKQRPRTAPEEHDCQFEMEL